MLTESQFREIADSLRDIVNELKKMNKPDVISVALSRYTDAELQQLNEYQKEFHSGPSIA